MAVIKSIDAPAKLAAFSMADIDAQANAIILRAKDQAGRIIAEAQRVGEELKREAHAKGVSQGRQAGMQQGINDGKAAGKQEALGEHRESLTKLVQALSTLATDLDASRRQLESEATADVMRLAIAIARKVTKRQGLADPQVLTANVIEAMKLTIRASDVRIAVAPAQKQTLEDAMPQLKMNWPSLKHVEVVEDDSLDPGGCRIFTGTGQIDADLDGQIDRIAAELLPNGA